MLVGIVHFLLFAQLAVIVNEIRVVISSEGFTDFLSFPGCLLGGRNALCAIHEGAYDQVFMLG